MPIPSNPPLLANIIGYAAEVYPIPTVTPSGTGQLSYQSGWPAITSVPLEAGGIAPQREYFNAINKLFSEHLYFLQSGCVYPWNSSLNYQILSQIKGTDGYGYIALKESGPGTARGPINPVGDKTGTWTTVIEYYKTSISAIIKPGGGLALDDKGQIIVDFTTMPPDNFKGILKEFRNGLHLQLYLEKDTTFYVRKGAANATDEPAKAEEETWGKSASKPFATIQGGINYVTENYNIGQYTATIDVSGGIHEESLVLNNFNRTTGRMVLKGEVDNETKALSTVIQQTNKGLIHAYTGSAWQVQNIKLKQTIASGITQFTTGIQVGTNAELTLERFELALNYAGDAIAENANHRPINVDGNLYMKNTSAAATGGPSKITITGYTRGMGALLRAGSTGYMEMRGESTAFPNILCSGAVSSFLVLVGGRFAVNAGYKVPLGFQDNGVTGRRFRVLSGGQCTVPNNSEGEKDLEYFPGNEDGTVESSTFSWYK